MGVADGPCAGLPVPVRLTCVARTLCGPPPAGSMRLVADLDVVCFEGAHMPYVIIAVIFAIVYPVGVPLGLLVTLTRVRGQSCGGGTRERRLRRGQHCTRDTPPTRRGRSLGGGRPAAVAYTALTCRLLCWFAQAIYSRTIRTTLGNSVRPRNPSSR